MKEIISYLKKEWIFLFLFILLVSFSQSIILRPHLEFGFSPDDIWFFSDFSRLGPNPFSKFPAVWQTAGPYHAPHIYYNGILFSLFGFNYPAHQLAALIFKILSIISFYLLIHLVFSNRLLAFISGVVFSIHYASIGSFEMVSRTQDYLLITGINIFFILLHLTAIKRPKNILRIILTSATFFVSFFINPIRAYPIFLFILLIGSLIYLKERSIPNLRWVVKTLTIIFLPFILFFSLMGAQGAPYGNFLTNMQKASMGNLQVFLTPLTTIGGLFIAGNNLKFLNPQDWSFNNFIPFFLGGPLLILGSLTLFLALVIPKKPVKFFLWVFILNFILQAIIFLIVNSALNLPSEVRLSYDANTYTPAALLGTYIIVLTIFTFKEWLDDKQNIFLSLYLLGISFAVIVILATWMLQDFIYIPLGINGYSTLPSVGISAAISALLLLIYHKFRGNHILNNFAPAIFLILLPYLFLSSDQMQMYFKKFLDGGGMRASDQIYLKNKFWSLIEDPRSCNKFFYIDKKNDPINSYHYDVIMLDRFDRWYNLYSPFHSKTHCPVALLISNEEKLISSFSKVNNETGFNYKNFDGEEEFFPLRDFYAFKLQNRDIVNMKEEVLRKLNEKQSSKK